MDSSQTYQQDDGYVEKYKSQKMKKKHAHNHSSTEQSKFDQYKYES